MEACLLWLPLSLLLLRVASLTMSVLETADLVGLCGQTWQGDGLPLRSHSGLRRFYFVAQDIDCGLWVWAEAPGDRISFQFCFFLVYSLTPASPASPASLEPNTSSPEWDPCAPGSYLQFYEGPSGAPRHLGPPLCGLTIPTLVASSGPSLGLHLFTRGRPCVDFMGEVTSFWLGFCGGYFRCQNGRCIPPSLVYDCWDVDNCGDGSDPSRPPAGCKGPTSMSSQVQSTDGDVPQPLTDSLALGSAGCLQVAAERTTPAGRDPALQDAASKGPQLRRVTLAFSLLLASTGLLTGLLWCCCSPGQLAWFHHVKH
ncbi:LOW QUALITY PROTEIN: low-density lipoprotein receptor class A domain-containing protein 2 [Dugong dugon]